METGIVRARRNLMILEQQWGIDGSPEAISVFAGRGDSPLANLALVGLKVVGLCLGTGLFQQLGDVGPAARICNLKRGLRPVIPRGDVSALIEQQFDDLWPSTANRPV